MTRANEAAIEILKQIRDEIVSTRTDLGSRIDATNHRLDETNHRLSAVESGLLELAEQQRFVVRHLSALTTRA